MNEESNTEFYQIRLYSRGKVEIFQRVFSHRIAIIDGALVIHIDYSSSLNIGSYTHSSRPMEGIYDVQVIEAMDYDPSGPFTGVNVVINGSGKFLSASQDKEEVSND